MEQTQPSLSTVFATYNRPDLALRLLGQLAAQDFPKDAFEVIVVDDGSAGGVAARLRAVSMPCAYTVIAQENRGPAAARDRGVRAARGAVVIVMDDDMQVAPTFLAAHMALHGAGPRRVVLGHIQPDPNLGRMPLFERYHAEMIRRLAAAVRAGRTRVRGLQLCTGNVSFRRDDYVAVGGFDATLGRSEDRELGIRLEKAGCEVVFGDRAETFHGSDHESLAVWKQRSFRYGIYDLRIARKHRDMPSAHPWHFLLLVSPISRPLLLCLPLIPSLGRLAAATVMAIAQSVDRLGAKRLAVAGATLSYGLYYFSGVSAECGSARGSLAELRRYLADRHLDVGAK